MGMVLGITVAATVFLFCYPSSATFGIWSGVVATVCGVFHLLTVRDAKEPDACSQH